MATVAKESATVIDSMGVYSMKYEAGGGAADSALQGWAVMTVVSSLYCVSLSAQHTGHSYTSKRGCTYGGTHIRTHTRTCVLNECTNTAAFLPEQVIPHSGPGITFEAPSHPRPRFRSQSLMCAQEWGRGEGAAYPSYFSLLFAWCAALN